MSANRKYSDSFRMVGHPETILCVPIIALTGLTHYPLLGLD